MLSQHRLWLQGHRTTDCEPRHVKSLAGAVLAGVVTAIGLFGLTSGRPTLFGTPACSFDSSSGFDPLTGQPQVTYKTTECGHLASPRVVTSTLTGSVEPRAVPIPVGFGVGFILALIWLAVGSNASRCSASTARHRSG